MPNTKSAIRRTKRTQLEALVNRIRKSKYKSAVKQMSIYLESGKINEACDRVLLTRCIADLVFGIKR